MVKTITFELGFRFEQKSQQLETGGARKIDVEDNYVRRNQSIFL